MKDYKYELVFKEIVTHEDGNVIEEPVISATTLVNDKILNGFSRNHNDAKIRLAHRLFMELLTKLV